MSIKSPSSATKFDILSDYNLRGIIGKGTFSVVKLGEHKKTKEKVAIKILQKNKILNKQDLIRIEREIEILKRLKHPNVIKIHRIEEDEKRFFIIMEYCENGELFNRIVEKRCLTEDEASCFYYQLINGLEYIHKNNIVHRDLKPENLLLSKNDILKIIDFGLSNYTGYNILLGTPCGSPCYASPEMVSGQRYNGYMIDVWSTGIILFAMVNGYLPFEDNDNEILFGKILKCKIHYPRSMGQLTLDLMKKIITPDPKKRITLEQIKQHPFYLKGKTLFNNRYPELIDEINGSNDIININNEKNNANINNNGKIKEIIIKNVTPIVKNKILKNIKENKEKNHNNININTNNNNNNKYYKLNIKDINNIYNTYVIKEINSTIQPQLNSNKKSINTGRDHKIDTPSSLRSDEIPKDSDPIENSGKNNRNIKNKDVKISIKKNLKEEMNTINLTEQKNLRIAKLNQKSQDKRNSVKEKVKEISDQIRKVAKNLGETIIINKARTKEKDRKKFNDINYINPLGSEINDPIIEKFYQKEKSNGTFDNNTTTIATKMVFYDTNENPKNKYSRITHKIDKNSYLTNKINQAYNDKNKNLLNSKIAKISNTFSKRIQRKPLYGVNKENERNNNSIENNMNLTNVVNPTYVKIYSRMNSIKYNEHNNTMEESNNVEDIFNKFDLITENKKTLKNDNFNINTINTYNKTININERNISKPLMIGNTITTTQIQKKIINKEKELYKFNNYLEERNTINPNSERNYNPITKNKNLGISHNQNIKKLNNPTNNNNKIYRNNNSTNFKGVSPINDKYFDTITINNNNNINLHEPKLFIYVQNNNNNTISDNQRLKTESNQNKTKMIFKIDNKNNNIAKIISKNHSLEYNKNPGKRLNSNIIENKTINKNLDLKGIHKFTPIKNNQPNYNKDIITNDKLLISKKIYNSIDPNKKIYTFKNNDIIFNNIKGKDNKLKYITNKNNNNMYSERNYNTINNKNLKTNTMTNIPNNFKGIDKSDYIYQNMHNIVKTDGNMDLWNYDQERILNENNDILFNDYINGNNQRTIRGEKINNFNNKNNFDNVDYNTKMQNLQMKNYIINNKENDNRNMKYLIQNNQNAIDSLNYYKRINPIIISSKMRTPETKQNNKNMINFKQYVKHY